MSWPLISNLISMAYDSVNQGANDDTSKVFKAVMSQLTKGKSSSNNAHQSSHDYERNLQTPKLF